MIGLLKDGNKLVLNPNTEIKFEQKSDILNPESSDNSYTWPFTIPTKPNAVELGSPEDLSNNQNAYKDYADSELTINDNVWKKGVLSLEEADDFQTAVNFKTAAGVLSQYKDTLIADLVNIDIGWASRDPTVTIPLFNSAANSPLVFPLILTQNKADFQGFGGDVINLSTSVQFLPCWKINYVLKQICITLGYSYHDNISSSDNDFKNWILFSPIWFSAFRVGLSPELPPNISLSDYLPEITFGDLLSSIRALTSAKIKVDPEKKAIHLISNTRTLKATKYADFNKKVSGTLKFKRNEVPTISLSLDGVMDAHINTEKLTGQNRGVYADQSLLAAIASKVENDYAFCTLENMYFKYIFDELNDESYWDEYLTPYQTNLEKASKSLKSKLIPVHKRNYIVRQTNPIANNPQLPQISDNGAGKVRLTHAIYLTETKSNIGIWLKNIKTESGNDNVYSDLKLYTVLAVDAVDPNFPLWYDIDLDWVEDGEAGVYFKIPLDYFVPAIIADEAAPRIAIYHGMQDDTAAVGTYAFASSDPYNSPGVKIGNEAIRFTQAYSLMKTYWKLVLHFMKNTRVVYGKFTLDVDDLFNFDIFTKVRIKGVDILLRRLKSVYSNKGLKKQDFEGYKV